MTELYHLETLSEAKNFNDMMWKLVERYVGRKVLEVGMGIGNFTDRLFPRADLVVGVELVDEFLNVAREKYDGRPKLEIYQADMAAPLPKALKNRGFDTVLCMNVLEHIEDDMAALRNFHQALAPGGRVILVIPDCPWLFNRLDFYGGHFRRYSRSEARSKLREAGFEEEHVSSFNLVGILGWWVNGTLLRRKYPPVGHVKLFDRMVPWLDRIESLFGPPFGMSLVVVGRKP